VKDKMGCFSPPVMLATFFIEIGLALYVLFRYKVSRLTTLVMALLVSLAIFQMAEYFVCGGMNMSAMTWSRIGYVAITLLPPIGLHILYTLHGRKQPVIAWIADAVAIAFASYFLLGSSAFAGYHCSGNYVIFQMHPVAVTLYSWYYYGLLLLTVIGGIWLSHTNKKRATAIHWFVFGYVAFILPATTVNVIKPETVSGIPSIMCGFAVVTAVVTALLVLPAARAKRS
jgi:hypothetical protein